MMPADSRMESPEYTRALARARDQVRELRHFYQTLLGAAGALAIVWSVNLFAGGKIWAWWPTIGITVSMSIWWLALNSRRYGGWFGLEWEERKVEEIMARANLKRVASQKDLVQAQLRMLQAQIEPHFLFNTLANVQSLIKREPQAAHDMLDRFIGYLRQSLSASRSTEGTLGQELELLQTYLDLLKVRMGERLSFAFEVPPDLRALPLAPMLLQPLVENAVRHGLEPKLEGGSVRVSAQRLRPGTVEIRVRDDGLGLDAAPLRAAGDERGGGGVGLSNLRERLAVLYDGRANLQALPLDPGTEIRLTLPV
jgi:LytS/YehU family sensor histidine kinase